MTKNARGDEEHRVHDQKDDGPTDEDSHLTSSVSRDS
jgi:hypothetical protein